MVAFIFFLMATIILMDFWLIGKIIFIIGTLFFFLFAAVTSFEKADKFYMESKSRIKMMWQIALNGQLNEPEKENIEDQCFPYYPYHVTARELVGFLNLNPGPVESLSIVYINKKTNLFYFKQFEGSQYNVEVKIKELIGNMHEDGFDTITLLHSHPGKVSPSKQDIASTKALMLYVVSLGLKFDDHIIYNKDNNMYYSFYENRLIDSFEQEIINFVSSIK